MFLSHLDWLHLAFVIRFGLVTQNQTIDVDTIILINLYCKLLQKKKQIYRVNWLFVILELVDQKTHYWQFQYTHTHTHQNMYMNLYLHIPLNSNGHGLN